MKRFSFILIILFFTVVLFSQTTQMWYYIQYDEQDIRLNSYEKAGIIETDVDNPGNGWI